MVQVRVEAAGRVAMTQLAETRQTIRIRGTPVRVFGITHVRSNDFTSLPLQGQGPAADTWAALGNRPGHSCSTLHSWLVRKTPADGTGATTQLGQPPITTLMQTAAVPWDPHPDKSLANGHPGTLPHGQCYTASHDYLGVQCQAFSGPTFPVSAPPETFHRGCLWPPSWPMPVLPQGTLPWTRTPTAAL